MKAKTLELLDEPEFSSQQSSVKNAWNDILTDPPKNTDDFLRWIYASRYGKRPRQNNLFEDFLDAYFPQHNKISLDKNDADQILNSTKELQKEIEKCRKLIEGKWPYDTIDKSLSDWHANRLYLLMGELNHTNCMPLLLTACELSQRSFFRIIDLTERFFFKFKLICGFHAGSLNSLYQSEAQLVRLNKDKYKVSTYKRNIQELLKKKEANASFNSIVADQLKYNPHGGSNKTLRYFLVTAEYYLEWYKKGAQGEPKYDKNMIIEFRKTSVEHIHPRKAISTDKKLNELMHSLGNLTILGEKDQDAAGNKEFAQKKPVFSKSPLLMNREIATCDKWDVQEVRKREKMLVDVAKKIFKI